MKRNLIALQLAAAVLLLLSGAQVFAQGATPPPSASGATPPYCTTAGLTTSETHAFPDRGYWMQSDGGCRMTFTGWGGVGNQCYNTCTNQRCQVSGSIDAYAIAGTGLYITPMAGIAFIKFSDQQGVYTDPQNYGDYESAGVTKDPQGNTIVRVMQGTSGGQVRDYKIVTHGSGDSATYDITPVQDHVIQICRNVLPHGLDTQIPIISRDGTMVSTRNYQTQKTEIYTLSMPSGACTLKTSIPFDTSKVSFSFDNKSVTFVVRNGGYGAGGRLMRTDLATGKTITLSSPDERVDYMSYKPDGTILYTRNNSTGGDDLVGIDPASVDLSRHNRDFAAIGYSWAVACSKDVDLDQAIAVGERLSNTGCSAVLTQANMDSFMGVLQGTPNDLSAYNNLSHSSGAVTVASLRDVCGTQATSSPHTGRSGR